MVCGLLFLSPFSLSVNCFKIHPCCYPISRDICLYPLTSWLIWIVYNLGLAVDGIFVCPSPNSYVEIIILNVMVFGERAFGRSLGHEGEALMMELAPLYRDRKELALLSLSLSPSLSVSLSLYISELCEDIQEGSHVRTRSLPKPTHAGTLSLEFPASKAVRSKFLVFKPPSLRYFCYSHLNWLWLSHYE